jgi:hypothetical protein
VHAIERRKLADAAGQTAEHPSPVEATSRSQA